MLNSYNAVANLLYWHQGGGHNSRDLVAILVIRPIAREALLPTGAEGLDDDGKWGKWLLKVLWMTVNGFGWCAIPMTLKRKAVVYRLWPSAGVVCKGLTLTKAFSQNRQMQ